MTQQTYGTRKLCFLLQPKEKDADNCQMFSSECDENILESQWREKLVVLDMSDWIADIIYKHVRGISLH